jgi:hypothetical protein
MPVWQSDTCRSFSCIMQVSTIRLRGSACKRACPSSACVTRKFNVKSRHMTNARVSHELRWTITYLGGCLRAKLSPHQVQTAVPCQCWKCAMQPTLLSQTFISSSCANFCEQAHAPVLSSFRANRLSVASVTFYPQQASAQRSAMAGFLAFAVDACDWYGRVIRGAAAGCLAAIDRNAGYLSPAELLTEALEGLVRGGWEEMCGEGSWKKGFGGGAGGD